MFVPNTIPTHVLAGDYNNNGVVDAADYTVWRNMVGQSGDGLAADGDLSGTVDGADFDLWQASFGAPSGGAGALSRGAVPEPSSLLLLAIAIGALFGWRAAGRRGRR